MIKTCPRCKRNFDSKLDNNYCPSCVEDMISEEKEDGDIICPRCDREYDEIDFEYQICHWCKYDNSK